MKYAVHWTEQAMKQLSKVDRAIARRIHEKMEWFGIQEDPLSFAKKLVHPRATLFRFRIGDYRTICSISESSVHILFVLEVKNRKDAY